MDNYPFPNQGGPVQTWGLSKELAKRGHEVLIIRRSSKETEETINEVTLVGLNFIGIENIIRAPFLSLQWHIPRPFSSLYFSRKSVEKIKKINPDIICLINRTSGIFPSRLSQRKVFVMHSADALDFCKPYSLLSSKLSAINFHIQKSMEQSILHKVDKVVVLNRYLEKYLRENGLCNVKRIPNAIDFKDFENMGDEKFILYAGKFDWNKNVSSLICAFAELKEYYPNFRLFLVGSGPEESRIRQIVSEKNIQSSVKIIPWMPRNKLLKMIGNCSVFVLPSSFENCAVTVLEAMASSKPVIAKKNMGTVDIIKSGKNGYLFNNKNELKNCLNLLLRNEKMRSKIGCNARKTVAEKYCFPKIAIKYEELFNELVY